MTSRICRGCEAPLVSGSNWKASNEKRRNYSCKVCDNTAHKVYLAKKRSERDRTAYVYVLSHPSLNKIKVGMSNWPETRLEKFNSGCPDKAFKFAALIPVTNMREVERRAHELLSPFHYSHEWFTCSIEQAIEAIQAASS